MAVSEDQRRALDELGITPGTGRVHLLSESAEKRLREAGGQKAVDACHQDLMNGDFYDYVEVHFIDEDDESVSITCASFED